MIRPADHLRGGKLCRDDQVERDRMIADFYRSGESMGEIAAAFGICIVTVWSAVRRLDARITMFEVARHREARRRRRATR